MSAVVGLFSQASDLPQEVRQIQEAGFGKNDCQILRNENAVNKILSYEPTCVLTKYARWGAFAGIMIFSILILQTVVCGYVSYSYPPRIEVIIASVLVGAGVGAIMKLFTCTAELERIMEFFTQEIRKGGNVILVQANEKDCERVQIILRKAGLTNVQIIYELDDEEKK